MADEKPYAPMLGAELRAWRTLHGYTQADASRLLDVSITHIGNYEYGRAKIPRKVQLATVALSLSAADAKPKRDGRYNKPINWAAQGKVIFVYQNGMELGYDATMYPTDPSHRPRAKDEASLRAGPLQGIPIGELEERDDGWHVAIHGSKIPA